MATATKKRPSHSSRNTSTWTSLDPSLTLLTENTRKAYVSTITSFRQFLDGREASGDLARTFFLTLVDHGLQGGKKGLKATSLHRHAAALRWLFVEVLNQETPRFPKVRPEQKEPRYLTLEQAQAVVAACETPQEKAVIYTLYGAGLRVSELLGLTREDIDPMGYLRIWGKGGRQERVPVADQVTKALADHLQGKRGQGVFAFGYSRLRTILNTVANRAGVPRVNPHAYRHSFVTHSLMAGAAVQDVSRVVRHRNLQTTMGYTHLAGHELRSRLPNLFQNEKTEKTDTNTK